MPIWLGGATGMVLKPAQMLPYASLSPGSVLFPSRFSGFAFAAIAIGALAPPGHYTMTRADLWAGQVAEFMRWVEAPRP